MTGKLICKSCGGSPDAHKPTCPVNEPEPAKPRTDCGYVVSQSRIALLEAKAAVCDAILDADEYSWRWTAGAPQRDRERFELAADALRELQEKSNG